MINVGIIGCGFVGGALKDWLEHNNPECKLFISDPPIKTEIDTIVAFREQMRDKYPCVDYRTAREFGDALMSELEELP